MESKNPAFNLKTLANLRQGQTWADTQSMTLSGTINKVGMLVVLTMASSIFAYANAESDVAPTLAGLAIIVNLILAFVIIWNKSKAPILAPIYAVVEGLALGFIAYMADRSSHGIALQAFSCTFGILFGMVGLYKFGLLRATETFKRVISVAMVGILLTYVIDAVMGFFHGGVPMIHEGTPVGIGFSLFVVAIASFSFILDFDMIEKAVAMRAPKWMEWYAGFSVLLTIIWLYIEILRLLGKRR